MTRTMAIFTALFVLLAVASCESPQLSEPQIKPDEPTPPPSVATEPPAQPPQVEPEPPAEKPEVEPAAPVQPAEPKIDEPTLDPNEVLISYGDKQFTIRHLLWMEPRLSLKNLDQHLPRLAKWWLETHLLYEEALRRGLDTDPKVQFLADLRHKYAVRFELQRSMSDDADVTDEEIRQYYEQNKQTDPLLRKRGMLAFNHVTTKTQQQAQAVVTRISAGEDIKAIAEEMSIHRDAEDSGVVAGPYDRLQRQFGQKLTQALTQAQVGQLVGPIQVQDGNYEVALLKRKVEPELLPFEKVADRIRSRLQQQEGNRAYADLLQSLKDKTADKVTKSPRLLATESARQRPATPDQPAAGTDAAPAP